LWEGKEMSEIVELLYPIYLDIPMMISFVATMDGGYSLETETREERRHQSRPIVVPVEEISHHAQDGNVDWEAQYDTTKKALDDIAARTDRIARMGPKPEAVPL
jgi:hypothetical protein